MPEVNYLIPEGVSQILFVIDGKFTAEEESTFNLLEDSIFGNDIAEYITIVRTKFSNFKNERECKKDKDDLYNENETVAKLCKSIVHIDNPPINIFVHDEDDRETIIVNERRREKSRTILLDHLNKVISEKYYDKIFLGNVAGPIGDTLNFKNYNDQTINLAQMNRSVRMKSKKLNRSLNLENPKFSFNIPKVGIRNLLIVGRINSGKSTLAEVLGDSHYYSGKIEKKYNVIDVDVTKPIKNIIKLSEKIKEICHILFVIDGKITADEVEAIFGNDIHEHITIVRTKFSNFKNEDKCKKDKEDLCKQNEAVAKIRQNIVYVDNPPININVKDKDDEATIKLSKKRRDWSRTKLLDHLNKVFQEKGDELCNEIAIESITEELKRNLKPEIPEEIGRDNYILKFLTSYDFNIGVTKPAKNTVKDERDIDGKFIAELKDERLRLSVMRNYVEKRRRSTQRMIYVFFITRFKDNHPHSFLTEVKGMKVSKLFKLNALNCWEHQQLSRSHVVIKPTRLKILQEVNRQKSKNSKNFEKTTRNEVPEAKEAKEGQVP
ncbi:14804_t:CDS:2 [Rhizophagus irregularis]|nr:14804_t:CDS:2 [Rhizophagus irregularis]